MFFPYPTEEAYRVCCQMARDIDDGFLVLERISPESEERSGQGVMLGSLICRDREGKTITLKAVSGVSWSLHPAEGLSDPSSVYVTPIVKPLEIEEALKKNDREIHILTDYINNCRAKGTRDAEAEKKRSALCAESLDNVYNLYAFNCADGVRRSLKEICAVTNKGLLPPTGTGECAEIKLLDYAFGHNLLPLSMAEIYYTEGCSEKEIRCVPPCDERCGLLLPEMLRLHILYQDKDIMVVNKQSGVLSVPGRGPEKEDSIEYRFRKLFPEVPKQPAVHRLDMETSGLLILAFNKDAHRNLQQQFESGLVQKKYIALLDGVLYKKGIAEEGQMELYFRLDVDNRPHQIWDEVYGKKAVTQWKVLDVEKYKSPDGTIRNATRVLFIPHTGRTHQLRLASADSHGFGMPIIGDTLYGKCLEGERLMLHSTFISFTHPVTGQKMEFNCAPGF